VLLQIALVSWQRRLLQRVDPLLGLLLAFCPLVRIELVHKIVEREIGFARGLGNQPPLGDRNRIGRGALAGSENVRQAILRDWIVFQRGLVKQPSPL
jgi:hypothetical protein